MRNRGKKLATFQLQRLVLLQQWAAARWQQEKNSELAKQRFVQNKNLEGPIFEYKIFTFVGQYLQSDK